MDEADAAVKAFQASLEVYKLNLSFTKVTSPIDGQVSRYYLTLGNLVVQDQTLLTTVVSLDPMYVYFDVDEGTVLRVRKAINEGTIKRYQEGGIPVSLALQGEAGFPHQGTVDFVNNQVNPNTGSISVRGVLRQPQAAQGRPAVVAGHVRAGPPADRPAPSGAVGHRPGRRVGPGPEFVYVVDAQNKVQYRRVSTGALQEDGLRVITEGLKPDEWVVVGGLQQVRPRMQVKPEPMPMPSFGQPDASESPRRRSRRRSQRSPDGQPKQ